MAGQVLNLKAFNDLLEREVRKVAEVDAPKFVRQTTLNFVIFLLRGTPVDTGYARSGWIVTLHGAPSTRVPRKPRRAGFRVDPGGARTLRAAAATLARYRGRRRIWIANNVPYIVPLDEGHSQQAPHGIVGPALTNLRRYLRTLRDVRA